MSFNIKSAWFNVRAIISDNHSTNVFGYSKLVSIYGTTTEDHFIMYKGKKIYVIYDRVHLLKNIRNNFLTSQTFYFS